MNYYFSIALVAALLSGCASGTSNIASLIERQRTLMAQITGPFSPRLEEKKEEKAKVDQELDVRLNEEIDETNKICGDVIGNRERLAERRSRDTLYISLAGLAAGAVVAPALTSANAAANAPWISAFSGVGGASSLAVRQIDGAGYSGAADVRVINGIVAEVKKQMNIALDTTKSGQERYSAVIAARNECLYFPRASFVIVSDQPNGAGVGAGSGGGGDAGKPKK